ncbi:MAG: hypothetical protein ACREIB_02655 [Pseudomonadota bacterium]
MPRFVFRQKSGEANRPVTELAEHATKLGGKVLSQTASTLYVEGSEEMYSQLTAAAPDYVSAPEVTRDLPKPPRVSVKKRP